MKVGKFDQLTLPVYKLVDSFNFVSGVIYQVDNYDFDYVLAANTGNYFCCDCYPCTRQGEILEGYEYPVPISVENLKNYLF